MKQIIKTVIVFSLMSFTVACKKKDSSNQPTNNTNSTPITSTPTNTNHVNTYTANVNGQVWTPAYGETIYCSSIAYQFKVQSSYNNPYSYFNIVFRDTIGIVNLTKYGQYQAWYNDSQYTFKSSIGTMTISAFTPDSSGCIKKLKAKFSFQTDTVFNISNIITNGEIDYLKP